MTRAVPASPLRRVFAEEPIVRQTMNRTTRWLATCAAWLVIGAVATFAVAWFCAARADFATVWSDTAWIADSRLQPGYEWIIGRMEAFGAEHFVIYHSKREGNVAASRPASEFVPSWCGVLHAVGVALDGRHCDPDEPYSGPVAESGFGWPFRSMAAEWDTQGRLVRGISITPGGAAERALPTRIIADGFAADTALFGSVGLLLTVGIGAMRRSARQRAGRCTACGYRLERLTPGQCPECGQLISVRGGPPH